MITLNLPNQQQQIIQQACQVVGMDMDSFIIRQAYDNAVKILTPKSDSPTQKLEEEGLLTDLLKGKRHPNFPHDFVTEQRAMRDEWD